MKLFTSVLLFLGAAIFETEGAIECYTCNYRTGLTTAATGDSFCATSPSQSPSANSDVAFGCQTTYSYYSDGTYSISRSVSFGTTIAGFGSYCTSDASGKSTTCYCNSNKCNDQAISFPRAVQCYECSSSYYFDNGCGDKVDGGSKYVKMATGCRSCYKNVNIGSDNAMTYTRGCLRSTHFKDGCDRTENPSNNIYCGCDGKDFCNSAQRISNPSSFALIAVLSAALYKLFY